MRSDSTLSGRKDKEDAKERREERGEDSGRSEPKFYYNREERLKRLGRRIDTKRLRLLKRRRLRGFFILLIDLFLIATIFYFLNKPANLYMKQKADDLLYELNVTGIRGKKALIGFTIENQRTEAVLITADEPVWVRIEAKGREVMEFRKSLGKDTLLEPGESSSVIFLIDEDELPRIGQLELFYGSSSYPLFSKVVRF